MKKQFQHCLPVHFEVIVVFIVIEIHIWLSIIFIDVLELISIALRDDISETTRPGSSSIMGSIVEAASNVGLNLVVVSLINVRWFVICFSTYGGKKKIKKKRRQKSFHINNWLKWGVYVWMGEKWDWLLPFLAKALVLTSPKSNNDIKRDWIFKALWLGETFYVVLSRTLITPVICFFSQYSSRTFNPVDRLMLFPSF